MMGPEPTFHWQRWIGEALTLAGGLLAMAIVGILSASSVVWSWWTRRRRHGIAANAPDSHILERHRRRTRARSADEGIPR
jgi:hypothetical protein